MADQTYIFPSPLAVTLSGAGDFAVAGVLTVVGATNLTGLLTVNGGMTVPAGDSINMVGTAAIKDDGVQASAIVDAEVAHALNAVFDDTEVEAALDALGTKLNSVLAALRGVGIIAT